MIATAVAAVAALLPWTTSPSDAAGRPCVVGTFAQIAASGDGVRPLSCGVVLSGQALCWGNNQFGQLSVPDGDFVEVGAGPYHACGRRPNGTIECWGNDDSLEDTEAPVGQFSQLAIGHWGPNCARRTNGTVACWGYGQKVLDVPAGAFANVTAGGERACAFESDGDATCWRYVEGDSPGEIDMETIEVPVGPFAEISLYFYADAVHQDSHFCGRRPNGQVQCWTDENGVASWTAPGGAFVKLSAGGGFACGIRSDESLECWGPHWIEGLVPPEGEFVAAAAGSGHVCGLTADGAVDCTGSDETVSCPTSPVCGNEEIEDPETCDDGDTSFAPGDACTGDCWSVPCGQPVHPDYEGPVASDALFALRAAVGAAVCAPEVCDVDASSMVTTTDALAILKKSVNPDRVLTCA